MNYLAITTYVAVIIGLIVLQNYLKKKKMLSQATPSVPAKKSDVLVKEISLDKNPWKTAMVLLFWVGSATILLNLFVMIVVNKRVLIAPVILLAMGIALIKIGFLVRKKSRDALIAGVCIQALFVLSDFCMLISGYVPALFTGFIKGIILYYLIRPLKNPNNAIVSKPAEAVELY